MPSNPQRLTYLQHILRDGITPFFYRNGVRTLLGMPERDQAKAGRIHSAHSMPVGFRYRQQDGPGIVPAPQAPEGGKPPFWLGTRDKRAPQKDAPTSSGKDTPQGPANVHQKKSTPRSDALPSGKDVHRAESPPEKFHTPHTEHGEGSSAFGSPRGKPVWPAASGQEQTRSLPTSPLRHPTDPTNTTPSDHQRESSDAESRTVQKSKIDIPGSSHEQKIFPLLSEGTSSEDQSNSPRGLPLTPPHPEAANLPAHAPEPILPALHSLKAPGMIQPKKTQETHPPIMASTAAVNPNISLRANDASNEEPGPSPMPGLTPMRQTLVFRPEPRTSSKPADGLTSRSSSATSHRIEQLRQAVQELTAKKITRQSTDHEEPAKPDRPQFPVVPPQPVVHIQQLPRRLKAPDAFWERSHLGRMHLRLLR